MKRALYKTLEVCPPELAANIYTNGIHITGGGGLWRGLKQRLEQTIGLLVHIDAHPLLSVWKGISKALQDTAKFKSILI